MVWPFLNTVRVRLSPDKTHRPVYGLSPAALVACLKQVFAPSDLVKVADMLFYLERFDRIVVGGFRRLYWGTQADRW